MNDLLVLLVQCTSLEPHVHVHGSEACARIGGAISQSIQSVRGYSLERPRRVSFASEGCAGPYQEVHVPSQAQPVSGIRTERERKKERARSRPRDKRDEDGVRVADAGKE